MDKNKQTRISLTLLTLLLFVLCSAVAIAVEEYENVGGVDEDFVLGTSLWNSNVGTGDYATYTKVVTNPRFAPLVSDLDGDGTNEIVVFDNNQIRIFRNNILTPVDSIALPTADIYAPPIIFDVTTPQIVNTTYTLVVQSSYETYIDQQNPTTSFGSSTTMNLDSESVREQRIISFYNLSLLPSNAVISSAVVKMDATAVAGATITAEARKLLTPFNESATWNTFNGVTSWGTAGGDFDVVESTTSVPSVTGQYSWNVPNMVNYWKNNPTLNYGLIVKPDAQAGGNNVKTFNTHEATSSRPNMTITYTISQESIPPRKEILVARANNNDPAPSLAIGVNVSVITYNGTGTSKREVGIYGSPSILNPHEILMTCEATEKCMVIWTEQPQATNTERTIAQLFNTSGAVGSQLVVRTGTNTEKGCFPLIPTISVTDVDNDGLNEYIYSQIYTSAVATDTADDVHHVFVLNGDSNQATLQNSFATSGQNLIDVGRASCTTSTGLGAGDYPVGKYISSPLVFDFDGSAGNGKEIILTYATSPSQFRMSSYQYDGTFIDNYPEIQTADGRILSNPMRMNAFPDTSREDFCTLGFKQDANMLDLICASMLTGQTPQTEEFMLDNSGLENYTSSYQYYNALSHNVQVTSTLTDGNNLDEILNLYGTFSLVWDDDITPLDLLDGDNSLLTEWVNPVQAGTTLAVDVQGIGRDDVIVMTPTNLWYFDDGFENQNTAIDFYQVNPCVDRTWKDGTEVNVQLRSSDPEGDDVSYRAILYDGDSNAQDSGQSAFFSSGTIASFSFQANKSIGIGTLTLLSRDDNHAVDDEVSIPFSVASTGAELNDCTTIVNVETTTTGNTTDEQLGVEPLDVQDNVIINPIRAIGEFTKLGVLGTFLLLLIALNLYVLIEKRDLFGTGNNLQYTFAILGIIDVLLIVLGAITLIIPFGLIVFIVIIGLLVLAFKFKDKLGGGMSNG